MVFGETSVLFRRNWKELVRGFSKGQRMKLNRKQKISLACGTVAVVFGALNAIFEFYTPRFDIYLVTVVLITAGCVYFFKDENKQA